MLRMELIDVLLSNNVSTCVRLCFAPSENQIFSAMSSLSLTLTQEFSQDLELNKSVQKSLTDVPESLDSSVNGEEEVVFSR